MLGRSVDIGDGGNPGENIILVSIISFTGEKENKKSNGTEEISRDKARHRY